MELVECGLLKSQSRPGVLDQVMAPRRVETDEGLREGPGQASGDQGTRTRRGAGIS